VIFIITFTFAFY